MWRLTPEKGMLLVIVGCLAASAGALALVAPEAVTAPLQKVVPTPWLPEGSGPAPLPSESSTTQEEGADDPPAEPPLDPSAPLALPTPPTTATKPPVTSPRPPSAPRPPTASPPPPTTSPPPPLVPTPPVTPSVTPPSIPATPTLPVDAPPLPGEDEELELPVDVPPTPDPEEEAPPLPVPNETAPLVEAPLEPSALPTPPEDLATLEQTTAQGVGNVTAPATANATSNATLVMQQEPVPSVTNATTPLVVTTSKVVLPTLSRRL